MGEQEGIRKLVDTFYDYMDTLPEVKIIRDLHDEDLAEARTKFYEFLVGWSGGPQLYQKKYGHPRLRMRHMPFPIVEAERDQWMLCMNKALEDCIKDIPTKEFLSQKFFEIADFMQNT